MTVDYFGDDVDDRDATADAAGALLSEVFGRTITAPTIRKWVSRGKAKKTGQVGRRHTYSLKELVGYASKLYEMA
jgi:hypothetical protein